jgi:Uma2 family endonuclease
MNEHVTQPEPFPETTQAAEGLPRRAWTVAEIEAMVRAGIIDEDERFELLGGEVVPMSPKGARHEWVKIVLNRHFQLTVGPELWIAQETTLRLDAKSFVEPDFCFWPNTIMPGDMRGYDVLLAVEVADTSLAYDRGRKIGIYAAYGIGEVWVIDANSLVTRVHRRLGAEGYRDIFDEELDANLVAERVPEVRVNLAELGLTPLQQ